MKELALIIDTNSRYSDVWAPCFGRLERFFPKNIKKYIFVDIPSKEIPDDIYPIYYDDKDTYRNQFLSCLEQIDEEYILYSSEDYLLYGQVHEEKLRRLIDILDTDCANFVKLIKGPESVARYKHYTDIFSIDPTDRNFFAQQASIWRTRDFESVFRASPSTNGRMQQEPQGSEVCQRIGIINGLQHHNEGNKRGIFHYDSTIFPCIATAVVKGKWNISEYFTELMDVFEEYNIDMNLRGSNA